jgi:hypothetical protein
MNPVTVAEMTITVLVVVTTERAICGAQNGVAALPAVDTRALDTQPALFST